VVGAESPDNVDTYVNTLIVRRCDLVLAVGAAETASAVRQAPAFPASRFAVVGASAAGTNIARIDGADPAAVTAEAKALLVEAFDGRFAPGPVAAS
jgi:hypothetical protein